MTRPSRGIVTIAARLLSQQLLSIDQWRSKYGNMSRQAALRALIESGLAAEAEATTVTDPL
jgi:hypothetical protein